MTANRPNGKRRALGLTALSILFVLGLLAVAFMYDRLSGASATPLSVTQAKFLTKSGLNNNVSAYSFFVSVDDGSRYSVTSISPEMIQALGLKEVPNGEVRLNFEVEDFSIRYALKDTGRHIYSLYTSEAMETCLGKAIPWAAVDIESVRAEALRKSVSNTGAIRDIPGGSVQPGASGSEWAWWLPNPSQVPNCPQIPDDGDWKAVHVGGLEEYDVVAISSVAVPSYRIRVSLEDVDGNELASTYVTSTDRQSSIGDYLRARWSGSFLASQFQPIPAVDTIILRRTGTDTYYEVDKMSYSAYRDTLERLQYTDVDEFGYIFEAINLTSSLTATPVFFDMGDDSLLRVTVSSAGKPVSGAHVFLDSTGGIIGSASGITNTMGTYTTGFTSSLAGKYQIDAHTVYLGSDSSSSVQVSLANPNVVLISMAPSTINTGQTSTVSVSLVGSNVGGANIKLVLDGSGSLDSLLGVTNAAGTWATTYRPSGTGASQIKATVTDKYGNKLDGNAYVTVVNPPPPVRSDPAIGGSYILGSINEINSRAKALPNEAPAFDYNCDIDVRSFSLVCRPDNPVIYPTLVVDVWADYFKGFYVPEGKPAVTYAGNITLIGGTQQTIPVRVKNVGTETDTFDVNLDCPVPLSYVPKRVSLKPGEEKEVSMTVQGEGIIQQCSVRAESLNVGTVTETPMFVGVTPLCDYCDDIPKENLVWTEYGGAAIEVYDTCLPDEYYDTTLDRCVGMDELATPDKLLKEAKTRLPSQQCEGSPRCIEATVQYGDGIKPKCTAEGEMMTAEDYWLEMNHGTYRSDGKNSNPTGGWYYLDVPYCQKVAVYGMEESLFGNWVQVDLPFVYEYRGLETARLIRGEYSSPVDEYKPPPLPVGEAKGIMREIIIGVVVTILSGVVIAVIAKRRKGRKG